MAIRVAVADDNLLIREGLGEVLRSKSGLDVVASCEDLPSLLETVESTSPDVVVTDIRMPPSRSDEGIRAAIALRSSQPSVGVIVLSQFAEPAYALALLETGSDGRGYLLKDRLHDAEWLGSAVEIVADGGSVIDPKVVELLVTARLGSPDSPLAGLTPRERAVLAGIAEGKSNSAIGESLYLTKRSVEKHINSIFLKLGLTDADSVSKRVKAALLFLAEEAAEARATVDSYVDPGVLSARLTAIQRPPKTRQPPADRQLSARELVILRMLSGSLSEREIARELYVSRHTIHSHTKSIYRKLGVSSRSEAVNHGRELGLP